VTYGNLQREIKRQRQMDEGLATPPQNRTKRNKTRILRGYHIESRFGDEDSGRVKNDSSWITRNQLTIKRLREIAASFFVWFGE
jgi:hypothetical protein